MAAGRLSPRYALALLEHLPPDSALMTSLRSGPEWLGWDRNSDLLAHLIDALEFLSWCYVSAHVKKAPKKPEPFPRPGDAPKKSRKEPNPLLSALKGEPLEKQKVGPGTVIPAPRQ